MATDSIGAQKQSAPKLKKTLSLGGVTINAMALIAPGAFLWLTFQINAAQTSPSGASTAMDIWFGLTVALILAFLTAASYAWLARRYPDAGPGSSYYFAQRALLDRGSCNTSARNAKFGVGWISHLYYWVYPGVMVAAMSILLTWILSVLGFSISPLGEIAIACLFAVVTGTIAYRGIQGSTKTNLLLNVVQIGMLVVITGMALAFRFLNPQHVTFTFSSLGGIVTPHDISNVLFQATIAILVLVGFESATAYAAEAKDPKVVPRAIILSLIIQGAFAYLFEYFGAEAWMNSSYSITSGGKVFTGFSAAAVSSAPIGDMVHNLGNVFLGGNGFTLELIVAAIVAAAILGTTLACMNTGVRVTYAISRDTEVPQHLSKLNPKYATPAIGIWVMTAVAAAIGSFGVLTITNLTAITLLSNFGTFMLYGLTNIIALIAFTKERSSILKRKVIPIAGFAANALMMATVLYLSIAGGGTSRLEGTFAIAGTALWLIIGLIYFHVNSKSKPSGLFPFPGKDENENKSAKVTKPRTIKFWKKD
jgi:amino acid transporter